MTTYIISDTHLNHDNIKTYCQRPENFTELIDRNVRNLVKPTDILIHVGDVGIGKTESWVNIVKGWNCLRWLIRGNHDQKSPQWYVENGVFHMACDAMAYRGAWFTHKPSAFLPEGCHVNVHGHLHQVWDGFCDNDPEAKNDEFTVTSQLAHLPFPHNRLFAVEYTGYMAIAMDKFIQKPDKYQARGPNEETRKRMKEKTNG
jgi:calcineurin-like phosphoesterase family protein